MIMFWSLSNQALNITRGNADLRLSFPILHWNCPVIPIVPLRNLFLVSPMYSVLHVHSNRYIPAKLFGSSFDLF